MNFYCGYIPNLDFFVKQEFFTHIFCTIFIKRRYVNYRALLYGAWLYLSASHTMKFLGRVMENSILISFGLNLVRVRKDLGWSQEQLAIASGIGRSYMSGIERGQRNLGLLNICKIAATLEVAPSVLMDFKD